MFPLVRYFSVTSLIVFIIAFLLIFANTRADAINDLVQLREQNNIALTQAYANTILGKYGDFITTAAPLTADEIMATDEFDALHDDLRLLTDGSTIINIKIFSANGNTLYSNNFDQIGDDKSTGTGFLVAIDGGVASELVYKDTFNAFEGDVQDRDIVESYVSLKPTGTTDITGVIEIYDDVTVLLERIDARQIRLGLGLGVLLAILYGILYLIVRYAEQIMRKQHHQIERNVVELATANDQLKIANANAEEATRLKSEFLSTMSHELRTPLNAIIGYSGIMTSGMAGNIDEKATKMIARIQDSGQHLLMLINNVLDISKIEAGRLTIVRDKTDVRLITTALEDQLEVLAVKKQLDFKISISGDTPQYLMLDQERIAQILINLLSNAIKFTDQGSVKLDISWKNDNLSMTVTDTGMGIPAHSLDYIFEEFRQVDGTSKRKAGGTGLGLAIVRKFATAMDGTVKVDSQLGQGTQFTVVIPAEAIESVEQKTA